MINRRNRAFGYRNTYQEGQDYLLKEIYQRYSTVGGIRWLLLFFIQTASLSVRVFFRRKLGDRSIGFAHILFSYFWVRCFLFTQWTFAPPEGVNYLNKWLYYIEQFFTHLFTVFKEAITFSLGQGSQLIYWYSFIVLFLGILHFLPVAKNTILNDYSFTHSRGESVFFGWLEGTPVDLGFGRKISISGAFIRTVLDPLFITAIGYGVMEFLNEWQFGMCVILSGVALFIEEYSIFSAERNAVLNSLDADYLAKQHEIALSKYNRVDEPQMDGRVSQVGAVLATPGDAEKLRKHMAENKGKTFNTVNAKLG